jgi:hypothetical protein
MEANPKSEVLAVETHNGRIWSAIILLILAAPALAIAFAPGAPRWPLIPMGIAGIFGTLTAWGGFQYRFLRHGVEVRMLGFRLRSIPRSAIVSYAIEPWAFIRGYGIRGLGRTRAYVWCNRVVHIHTTNADIYLGHNNPSRVIRDLDQMMGLATGG